MDTLKNVMMRILAVIAAEALGVIGAGSLVGIEVPTRLDSVVTTIIEQFKERSARGKAKYGVDLDRTDLSLLEWIEHAKQEHMDAILYLEKIKQIVSGKEKVY